MAIQDKLYTVQEFEAFIARPENTRRLFELVNGEIVEKMPTREHGIIAGNFVTEFNLYLRQNRIGRAAVEARHRPEGDDFNDRLPDVSLVLDMEKPVERQGAALYMPDLVVEVQSPSDSLRKMLQRAEFCLASGTKMVILTYPDKRLVEILTADDRKILTDDDILDLNEVLPGFTKSVRLVFDAV